MSHTLYMRKSIKITLVIIALVLIAAVAFFRWKSEPKPQLVEGDGDQMAFEMMKSVNVGAFESIDFLHWKFRGKNLYTWDKNKNLVVISWGNKTVHLNLDKLEGYAFIDGKRAGDLRTKMLVKKAWTYWCNDSYWLMAPFKVFDPGTTRSVAQLPDGTKGLWVEYASGGVTPGDGYFWKLDENNRPKAFKMWVSVLPIKGIEAGWSKWISTESGAMFSTEHELPFMVSTMEDIKEGHSWSDFGFNAVPEFPE